ncbi:C4-dicarboxylate ABC transporter permease [Kiloniella spongiae]|uniref:TRAP transporter large permease protein n=1 Tax=Kiloniella spongiae TaxID=1489064 RepID=A0A0H2MH51_9PROT|nr:TRAP transporter large permease [Kiloniella spongiae]KLN61728.1 C4-dicarboxylate ABC transporter permease [Kiloniella spongiae]
MEWYHVGGGLLTLLMVLISLGVPLPFALAAASLPFLWLIQDFSTSLISVELKIWGVWVDYILLAVPLFVFLGELIARSTIGPNLYRFMHRGVRVRGSAAYGSIGACAGFGAVCGSSMVGSLTIGSVALPEMLKLGYGKRLSAGVLAAGGTLSVLIPPSLILLFYGIVVDVSIGDLFIAGILPGITLTTMFAIVVVVWGIINPESIPRVDNALRMPLFEIMAAVLPILVIGLVITVSIYAGIATPTEAAAIAALLTLIIAVAVGNLRWEGLKSALLATMRTMGYLGLLLSAGTLFGFVLTYHQVPQQFTEAFLTLALEPYMVLAMVIAFYLVVGMFLEPVSITFITLPTLFPLISSVGYDLVWFGIIYTITMEIAVLTPPVGLNLYVIQGLAPKEIALKDVILGVLPFIGALAILIALLLLFPQMALYLPELAS